MQEMWVRSLGLEDALEKGMATYSSILAWRISMDRGAWWAGKVGNPFETKQWNRPSYRDQERRKASDEVVPGTSVSPLVRSVYRGTFGVASRVPSTVLHFKTECETSLEML